MNKVKTIIRSIITISIFPTLLFYCAQEIRKTNKIASKPLYRDPIHDGAADPVVIWNHKKNKWFILYTNRRSNVDGLDGVTWVHGTRIGIAESSNG